MTFLFLPKVEYNHDFPISVRILNHTFHNMLANVLVKILNTPCKRQTCARYRKCADLVTRHVVTADPTTLRDEDTTSVLHWVLNYRLYASISSHLAQVHTRFEVLGCCRLLHFRLDGSADLKAAD